MGVLPLRDSWGPQKYACTVRLGRKCFPQLPDHKLDTMCRYLDIPLDHHNAGSDAHAAAELLRNYLMRGIRMADFIKTYNYYD